MNGKRIELTVSLWIAEDADVTEVFENMDYDFSYEDKILDTEITDLNTEVA